MALTPKDFDKEFGALIKEIEAQATPFPKNVSLQTARRKRALADPIYFACCYFKHYLSLPEQYADVGLTPGIEIDPEKAGFAPFHTELYAFANTLGRFHIITGFRESAKSTHLGKIDVVRKLCADDAELMRWFIPIIAKTETKAEQKVAPIKIEFEYNKRLRQDFGNLVGAEKWEWGAIKLKNGRACYSYSRLQGLRGEEVDTHRPDHLVFDDISDPTNPDSIEITKKFVEMVKGNYLKAVNSPRWSGVFLANYVTKGDITDELMTGKNTGHYHKEIIRALIPNDLETKQDRAIAKKCVDAGFDSGWKSAWEYRFPTLRLLKERHDDPDTFDAEMMQRPRARKGQKFQDAYFRYHTRSEIAGGKYVFYSAVDPSAKEAGDYKATITVGVGLRPDGETIHIPVVKAAIEQCSTDDMLKEGYEQNRKYHPKIFGVEMIGFAILLEREYKRLAKQYGLLPFHKVDTKNENKESRIERLVDYVKDGTITFDLEDPDQELLIQQLKAFPNGGQVSRGGVGDDGPDALEMCVRMIETFPPFGEWKYETVQRREMRFDEAGAY